MKPTPISLKDYEAAEREFVLRRNKRFWLLHASLFGIGTAIFAIVEAGASGALWWPYVLFVAWAIALFTHYNRLVRYGDAHERQQQIRIEWRANRAKEDLVPR